MPISIVDNIAKNPRVTITNESVLKLILSKAENLLLANIVESKYATGSNAAAYTTPAVGIIMLPTLHLCTSNNNNGIVIMSAVITALIVINVIPIILL